MNKKYFTALAEYNIWANNRMIEWLNQISAEQWEQPITSSFNSIRLTAVHIASAEKIWIDFWQALPHPVYLSAEGDGVKKDIIGIWKTFSHIINHSTYHRGQLVTMLRQADFAKFSSIDLATYYRTMNLQI